jgi:hypothetical protein
MSPLMLRTQTGGTHTVHQDLQDLHVRVKPYSIYFSLPRSRPTKLWACRRYSQLFSRPCFYCGHLQHELLTYARAELEARTP